jgi:hypothetical protein
MPFGNFRGLLAMTVILIKFDTGVNKTNSDWSHCEERSDEANPSVEQDPDEANPSVEQDHSTVSINTKQTIPLRRNTYL